MRKINRVGQVFGRLTVLTDVGRYCFCKCTCYNFCLIKKSNLPNGHTSSCGCFNREEARARATTHGNSGTRWYTTYHAMKGRCYSPGQSARKRRYQKKGIQICKEWLDNPEAFYAWCEKQAPAENLTIERVDNEGHYTPENCTWATPKEQVRNQSRRKFYEYKGESLTLKEIIDKYHPTLRLNTIVCRLRKGMCIREAVYLST